MKESGFNKTTIENMKRLFDVFRLDSSFNNSDVMNTINGSRSTAFRLLGNLKDAEVIVTNGKERKGKYRFRIM